MQINSIQISNVLTFKYHADINHASKLTFDKGINILIGQNGAGKSTALEVINFIFRRVIFIPYNINLDVYSRREQMSGDEKKQILARHLNNNFIGGFRLNPNWETENLGQKIRIEVSLDAVDEANLVNLESHKEKLSLVSSFYTTDDVLSFAYTKKKFSIEIVLNPMSGTFTFEIEADGEGGFNYLRYYERYRQLISLHNQENIRDLIPDLYESFTLIGGYRNYNSFSPSVSLATESANQIQLIKANDFQKSTNSNELAEPSIFNLVRLKIAERHHQLIFTDKDDEEATNLANETNFITSINEKLKLVSLKVAIKLVRRNTWEYSFDFIDSIQGRILKDINSLSAGQKAIIHLVFESYGRGLLNGGIVIIDEPELHLHYQFQHEYLKILERLHSEQNSQYILVTHSEALINSRTIDRVKRFSLDEKNHTQIKTPTLSLDEKNLVKILDNTRSTYAFFARKVILVEGDSDRYFFREALQILKPELQHEIAVLDIGGKGNFKIWQTFFESFGLMVYAIGDFDNAYSFDVNGGTIISKQDQSTIKEDLIKSKLSNITEKQQSDLKKQHEKLTTDPNFCHKPNKDLWKPLVDMYSRLVKIDRDELTTAVKQHINDIDTKIESLYSLRVFILKQGNLEVYTGTKGKDLGVVRKFCENLPMWLNGGSEHANEVKMILTKICAE